jgi:hypothetical protein
MLLQTHTSSVCGLPVGATDRKVLMERFFILFADMCNAVLLIFVLQHKFQKFNRKVGTFQFKSLAEA